MIPQFSIALLKTMALKACGINCLITSSIVREEEIVQKQLSYNKKEVIKMNSLSGMNLHFELLECLI